MERIPQQLRKITGLKFLTVEDLSLVEQAAASISFKDCFDLLMISIEDVPAREYAIMEAVHKRGRMSGVKLAVDKLFTHMSTRNGGQSAIEYLSKMSGEFAVQVQQNKGNGFSFNVVIPEDKAK